MSKTIMPAFAGRGNLPGRGLSLPELLRRYDIRDLYETLTTREREVLHLAAEGYSNPEIAARLSIGTRTAETHRANVLRKLRLLGQTDLVRYALGRGILPVETKPGTVGGRPPGDGGDRE